MKEVTFREFALFCVRPRTRKEVQAEFKLTTIESWHLVKRMAKYNSDIIVTIRNDLPGAPRYFKTRKCCLDEIRKNNNI